jgi:DNA-binding response OmpR family regulator
MPKILPRATQFTLTNESNKPLTEKEDGPERLDSNGELLFGDLRLDKSKKLLRVNDQEARLTGRECNMLELFIQHPEQVLTRQQIYNRLWDNALPSPSNTVDVHIKNLRKKIRRLSERDYLRTVRGVGYCLSPRPVNY